MTLKYKIIISGLATAIFGIILALSSIGNYLEEGLGLHMLFFLRSTRPCASDVVFININDISKDKLGLKGGPQVWSRAVYAELLNRLIEERPAVIAFDMVFDEERDAEGDRLFSEAIREAGNIILCEGIFVERIPLQGVIGENRQLIGIERLIKPASIFAEPALELAPFPLPKVPVKVNHFWPYKKIIKDLPTLPSVAFQVYALKYYDAFINLLKSVSPEYAAILPENSSIILKDKGIAAHMNTMKEIFNRDSLLPNKMFKELNVQSPFKGDKKKQRAINSLIRMYDGEKGIFLNFYGPAGTLPNIDFYKAVKGDFQDHDLKGKVIFIGMAELYKPGKEDYFHTVYSQYSGVELSGLEIAATAFANLAEDMSIKPLNLSKHLAIILVFGLGLGILCFIFPTVIGFVFLMILAFLYTVLAVYFFKNTGSWYPLIIPLFIQMPFAFFGIMFWKYLDASHEREHIKHAIGYYLPVKLVDQLAKDIEHIKSTSETVYGVCLMTDAQRYTSLSEKITPKELNRLLNQYYEAIFYPVRKFGGMVSTITGDSMLAIWIADKPDTKIRNNACRAVLEINKNVNTFNASLGDLGLPTRMGLHAGYMVIGSVGAVDHYVYTPLGDIVNTSSRLEGLNKYLKTQILVTEEMLYNLDSFLTREVGKFLFLGKTKPLIVYELISAKEQSDMGRTMQYSIFAQALRAFRDKSWDEAIKGFNSYIAVSGQDGPSEFYLRLCEGYKKHPPDDGWNGIVCLDGK